MVGGLALGETLEPCLRRDSEDETKARVVRLEYLFVVESLITVKGDVTHGLGHFFEVGLDRDDILSEMPGIELTGFPSSERSELGLRPHEVRGHIAEGTYPVLRPLILRHEVG